MVRNKKSNKGLKMPPEFGEAISKRLKGRVFSEETKEKMSISAKNRKFTDIQREKMTEALINSNKNRSGGNSNFWKGGVTKLSFLVKSSLRYKEWRKYIFNRDNYCCTKCGSAKKLEVHHIVSFSKIMKEFKKSNDDHSVDSAFKYEPFWDYNNGITLCRECYKMTDNYLRNAKK